jgi:hypothetical protein
MRVQWMGNAAPLEYVRQYATNCDNYAARNPVTENQYQLRYWNLLADTKVHVSYLHRYAANPEWWDKSTNVFLAITSSGSIAAWAIWKDLIFLWPSLIALSQVITAVKPFMPFKHRLKVLVDLCNQLQITTLAMKQDWYSVAEGKLTEEEIHDLTVKYRAQSVDAEQRHLRDIIVPRKLDILAQAETDAEQYFRRHYPTREHS